MLYDIGSRCNICNFLWQIYAPEVKEKIMKKTVLKQIKWNSAAVTVLILLGMSTACSKKPKETEAATVVETTAPETENETTEDELPDEITGKVVDAAMHSLVLEDENGRTYELDTIEGVDVTKLPDGVQVDEDVTVELNNAGEIISIRPAGTPLVGETDEASEKKEITVTEDELKQLQMGVKSVSDLSYDTQNAGAINGVVIETSNEDGTIIQTVEGPVEFTLTKDTDKKAVGGEINPGDGVRVFFDEDGRVISVESDDAAINNPYAAVAAGEVILDVANDDFRSFAGKVQYPIIIDGEEYANAEALVAAEDDIWTAAFIKTVVTTDLQKTEVRDAGICIGNQDGPYVLINNDSIYKISAIETK